MGKLYTKNTWMDEVLTGDERYDIAEDDGTPYKSDMRIDLATTVAVAGTAANAAKMNNIENGIDAIDDRLVSAVDDIAALNAKNIETLSAAKTLTDASEPVQALDPNGSDRDVNLPTEASTNHIFYIINTADATENLVVKDDGGTTIVTIAQGESATLIPDGANWVAASSGGGTEVVLSTIRTYTSSGTWTKPADLVYAVIEVVGGGGGGGSATNDTGAVGAGGGGGGYSKKLIDEASLGATETVTVGAGGSASSSGAGGAGGTSSFGAHLSATGGGGGAENGGSFATRGSGSGGDINIDGGYGFRGGLATAVSLGTGGDSHLGIGAPHTTAGGNGASGGDYGGGGSGGYSSSATDRDGGAGGTGVVIVYEYTRQ